MSLCLFIVHWTLIILRMKSLLHVLSWWVSPGLTLQLQLMSLYLIPSAPVTADFCHFLECTKPYPCLGAVLSFFRKCSVFALSMAAPFFRSYLKCHFLGGIFPNNPISFFIKDFIYWMRESEKESMNREMEREKQTTLLSRALRSLLLLGLICSSGSNQITVVEASAFCWAPA